MRKPIEEILHQIYRPEKVLTQSFSSLSRCRYQASILLPTQTKSLVPNAHASNAHIAEAITELLYLSTATAVQQKHINIGYNFTNFFAKREAFYIRELNLKFAQLLRPNINYSVEVTIIKVEQRNDFFQIDYRIKGSVYVRASGLFPVLEDKRQDLP